MPMQYPEVPAKIIKLTHYFINQPKIMKNDQQQVTLQFLGCGDAFGSGGRFQTSFYVHTSNFNFLIDCGATTLIAMKKYNTPEIDAIILSHFHGDHYGGLPYFLLHEKYVRQRSKTLIIAGPQGLEGRVSDLMQVLYPGTSPYDLEFDVNFVEYSDGGKINIGPVQIWPYKVIHSEGANPHALRIKFSNKVLAYSGDTQWTDSLLAASEKADLFICECNFLNTEVANHLDYETILSHQNEFTCKKLILTHMGDDMLQTLPVIKLDYAEDGRVISI